MRKIMAATDFSERSDRALRRATLLARRFEARLELLHVVDDDQPKRIVEAERDQAEALLKRTAATFRDVDGVDCAWRVVSAAPFVGIVEAVSDAAPDVVVIGPHRRRMLGNVFVGTTAERTIRSVGIPVLMVNAPPAGHYRHVLQTTDLSDASRDSLRRFATLGIGAGARNSLLHVFDVAALQLVLPHATPRDERDESLEDAERQARRELDRFVAKATLGDVRPMLRREVATAAHEILKAAEEEQADLVVVSTHGRAGLSRLMIGSVTDQVLRSASVDVLAIPPLRDG